jgi:hypothetical protein
MRSAKNLKHAIVIAAHDVCTNNKWDIRNLDLYVKMLTWIRDYMQRGKTSYLANLAKLE